MLETIFELEEKGEKAPAAQHSEGNIKHESTLSGHKPLHQKKDPESVRHTDPSQECKKYFGLKYLDIYI